MYLFSDDSFGKSSRTLKCMGPWNIQLFESMEDICSFVGVGLWPSLCQSSINIPERLQLHTFFSNEWVSTKILVRATLNRALGHVRGSRANMIIMGGLDIPLFNQLQMLTSGLTSRTVNVCSLGFTTFSLPWFENDKKVCKTETAYSEMVTSWQNHLQHASETVGG